MIGSFKTVSVETNPWEIKNITGYFDTTGLEPKRYTAKILISYDGKTTSKLVAIYINKPLVKTYQTYIIIAIITILIVISAFIFLIWKVIMLGRQNGKKKK